MSTTLLAMNCRKVFLTLGGGRGVTNAAFGSHFVSVPRRSIIDLSYSTHFMDFKGSSIPSSMKKLVVTKLSQNFREAVSLQIVPVPTPGDGDLLIRNRFVGINASDINYTAGRYDPSVKPPFDAGFEGIGEVVGLGLSASARFTVGDTVAYFGSGSFAEYTVVPAKAIVRVPSVKPQFLTLLVSGATAYIALKRLGDLAEGQTVLVTAAAGGTGQFAVQFAKMAKCHVVGTCSSDEKSGFLKTIGCDRPINYRSEDLAGVLQREYPRGLDVVYESVGAASSIWPSTAWPRRRARFFLPHFLSDYGEAMADMLRKCGSGELVCEVDVGEMTPEGHFVGLESVYRAVDHMYAGKNLGKVVVQLPAAVESKL
ncbi:hypothetical protein ANANG_G00013200 [Anguilla anguilla]|uniref:Enoyl reductase (ER) domain-containing protein n=1 Tax=Anguilla anguilla TaxID=7936 RepID=A0A9D3MXL6_ANGAN|nr:hypothetical protein ANANG_G00013200 [Anguilla anguilla]